MNRQPILPVKKEPGWTDTASAYRQSLHEDIYPKDQSWTPSTGGVTSASITGSYVRMARQTSFSIDIQGPTASSSGYIDLPFMVAQASVFNVAVTGLNQSATVNKGESRLYLPNWTTTSRALVSGVTVS